MKLGVVVNAEAAVCIQPNATSFVKYQHNTGLTCMPRWIAVDNEISSALRSRLPEQTIIQLSESSALEHALRRNETTVAVLPCRGLGQAALAVFRWNRIPANPISPSAPHTRAGGFLGLTDEVFEEEDQEKKSWWKRWWEG